MPPRDNTDTLAPASDLQRALGAARKTRESQEQAYAALEESVAIAAEEQARELRKEKERADGWKQRSDLWKERSDTWKKRAKDAEARETAVGEREKQIEDREKEVERREKEAEEREKAIEERDKRTEAREARMELREKRMELREKTMEESLNSLLRTMKDVRVKDKQMAKEEDSKVGAELRGLRRSVTDQMTAMKRDLGSKLDNTIHQTLALLDEDRKRAREAEVGHGCGHPSKRVRQEEDLGSNLEQAVWAVMKKVDNRKGGEEYGKISLDRALSLLAFIYTECNEAKLGLWLDFQHNAPAGKVFCLFGVLNFGYRDFMVSQGCCCCSQPDATDMIIDPELVWNDDGHCVVVSVMDDGRLFFDWAPQNDEEYDEEAMEIMEAGVDRYTGTSSLLPFTDRGMDDY